MAADKVADTVGGCRVTMYGTRTPVYENCTHSA